MKNAPAPASRPAARAALALLAAAACGLLCPAGASAQTTRTGHFRGDGTVGKYARTSTTAGDGGRTIQTVYTRTGGQQTRTDTVTTSAEDKNGGYTLDETRLDFGATTLDTVHETITRLKSGRHTGTGTYTTASGDGGTLTTVEAAVEGGSVTSEVRVSPTTGTTQVLRVQRDADDFVSVQTITLLPDGTATSTTMTREAGSSPTPTPAPTATPTPTVTPTPTT